MFFPHVGYVNISLSKQPITVPARPAGIWYFFGLCFLHRGGRFLLSLFRPVDRFGVFFAVTDGVLCGGLRAQR